MTEQEYCDLTDLQLCHVMLAMTRSMNCWEEPNTTKREEIREILISMIDDLEPKISKLVD